MPTRRQLLGSFLSLGTAGLLRSTDAAAQPATSKVPLLDRFNEAVATTEQIGDARIRFTGLKGSMDDDILAGQYLASIKVGHHGNIRYFVSTVPYVDGWGCTEYQKGAVFPVRYGVDHERLITDPNGVRAEILAARERLIAGLRQQRLIP